MLIRSGNSVSSYFEFLVLIGTLGIDILVQHNADNVFIQGLKRFVILSHF